jgi:hypothetical protein
VSYGQTDSKVENLHNAGHRLKVGQKSFQVVEFEKKIAGDTLLQHNTRQMR